MTNENTTITGVLHFNSSGSAFLSSDELEKDLFIHKSKLNKGLHLDTVEVNIIEGAIDIEGEVISIVKRFKEEFVGTLQVTKDHAFLIPDSPKMNVDIYIPKNKLKGSHGQKAVARLTSWPPTKKSPRGEIIEVLGDAEDNNTVIHGILHEFGLPYDFPKEVIEESEAISGEITEGEIAKRRDMRHILTFTIDPDTAKDFDDALSVFWEDGKLQVGIHIADVSHYLKEGSVLDKEAFARGTSVYLVDRVVPMLPERLSNGLCSLVPNEDRLCYSAIFTLSSRGIVEDSWFGRTIIHSNARLTYEQAQKVIESKTDDEIFQALNTVIETAYSSENLKLEIGMNIKALNRYAKMMRTKRLREKSISFDKKEVKFILDETAKPVGLELKVMKDSNKLIEEFMLLANKKVAALLNETKFPMVQRSHDAPNKDKLIQLSNFIEQFGYKIIINDSNIITSELNKLLIAVKGTPEENVVTSLVTRTMTKAFYSTKNIGHYGLGFENYSHFTSPIRRYPDVIAHRLLTHFLAKNGRPIVDELEGQCVHLSERERKAQKAQRASIKYKQAEYLLERIGQVFKGVVSSVTEYGIFIEMEENSCEGMVRLSDISGDVFTADVNNYCVKGYNTGEVIRIGDEVLATIKSVNMIKKEINLSLV